MSPATRSRLLWLTAAVIVIGGGLLGARLWLGGYVVRSVLRMAGATEIRHGPVRGTPWQLEIEDLDFRLRSQSFSARRVTLRRDTWWEATLGDVRVEGAHLPVSLDDSEVNPLSWDTYEESGLGDEAVLPPFRTLDLAGELIVRLAAVPERAIAITLQGRPKSGTSWIGSLLAEGEGFRLAGNGALLRAGQELDFQVNSAELDLALWSAQIQRLVTLPGGPWKLGGRLTGVAEGKVTARRFAATARVSLRAGRIQAGARDVTASGADADLEFSDLWKLRTSSGKLHLAELRVGRLPFHDINADFGLWDGRQLKVARASAAALGGRVEVGPFSYRLDERAVNLELQVAGLRLAELLALTEGVEPRLSGRAGGKLALQIHDFGVQVTGGYLATEPGEASDLLVNAAAMLRAGAQLDGPTERLLRAAGRQNVLVRLDECRMDVRSADLPVGTAARCRVRGRVDDQPVDFTYHVNGTVERFWSVLR